MGFSSLDDWTNKITNNGKTTGITPFFKASAISMTIGKFADLSMWVGSQSTNSFAGTALAWTAANGSSSFGIKSGVDVFPETKHLTNLSGAGHSSFAPGWIFLSDMQGYYPGINNNTTSLQTFTGTPTIRGAAGNVQMYLVAVTGSNATSTATIKYTNQDGTSNRTATVTIPASNTLSTLMHSNLIIPLEGNDYGVQSVQSIQFSAAGTTGTSALVLHRVLAHLPLSTAGIASERDLFSQVPSLPRLYDGNCLNILYMAGGTVATNAILFGTFEAQWG